MNQATSAVAARRRASTQGLANCTVMATVAATITPHGCGKGQKAPSSQAQNTGTITLHRLNRVVRTGSADFHQRRIGNKKPKYARYPFNNGAPVSLNKVGYRSTFGSRMLTAHGRSTKSA